MIATTGMPKLQWYELCPYMNQSDSTDMEVILDHIPEFIITILKEKSRVHIYIRIPKERLPLLDSLDMVEPIQSDPPKLSYGYKHIYRYATTQHCALPITPDNTSRTSIYQVMGDSVSDTAYLMLSLKKASYHPQIYHYIRRLQRAQSPGVSGVVSEFMGSRGKPGPGHLHNIALAQKKASSRHLFRAHIVVAAKTISDIVAIESVFPSMSFRRASSPKHKEIERISSRGPGQPIFGGAHSPILSDKELLSFVHLPDEEDMSAVPMNFGRLSSHSGGERIDITDATSIDIERDSID